MEELRIGVVIVAGGSGHRMGGSIPKQFAIVDGEPILARTINVFAKALPTSKIVVVLPAEQQSFWKNLSARFRIARHTTVNGGAERFNSVKNGIEAISEAVDLIAIQDGVRPFVSTDMIYRAIECAKTHGTAVPAISAVDSFREVDDKGDSHIVDRGKLRSIQTPQVFAADILRAAYDTPYEVSYTDDASVVERLGMKIALYEGERTNIKITTPTDMIIAEAIAQSMNDCNNDDRV